MESRSEESVEDTEQEKKRVKEQIKKYLYETIGKDGESTGIAIVVYDSFIAANSNLGHSDLEKDARVHIKHVEHPNSTTVAKVLETRDFQNILMMKLLDDEKFPDFPRESYGEKIGRKIISMGWNQETRTVQFSEGIVERYRNGYCYAQLENGAVGNGVFSEDGLFKFRYDPPISACPSMKPYGLEELKKYVYTTKPFNSESEGFAIVVKKNFIAANRNLAHQVLNKGSKVHLRSVACPRAVTDVTVKAAQDIQNIIMMKLNEEEQFPHYPRESYGDDEGRKVISVGLTKNKEIQFEEGVIEDYENGYCFAKLENGRIGNGVFDENGGFSGIVVGFDESTKEARIASKNVVLCLTGGPPGYSPM